ncbi:hypothetical protein [Streptomyces purpureus]|uniref:Uncharacterized protein n=1 Tax=Streptomyces purpureus TaxID=1951 RepID=A0A918LM60_9ACTN|nr:hypothetical protein [Streptomyces purpureus]GGT16219.1 hypothetical protein GCM10014713_06400 [Streptomyces purpureus]
MSASEKSNENPTRRNSSRTASNGAGTRSRTSRASDAAKKPVQAAEKTGNAATGTLTALPAPLAEKTLAAAQAVRGTGELLWTSVRDRKAVAGGTAAGASAAVIAYALGRRAGLRSRGPLSRLTGGRI